MVLAHERNKGASCPFRVAPATCLDGSACWASCSWRGVPLTPNLRALMPRGSHLTDPLMMLLNCYNVTCNIKKTAYFSRFFLLKQIWNIKINFNHVIACKHFRKNILSIKRLFIVPFIKLKIIKTTFFQDFLTFFIFFL